MTLKIFKDYEKMGDEYPKKAVQYALEHREEAIPELLEILDNIIIRMEKLSLHEYDEHDEHDEHAEYDECDECDECDEYDECDECDECEEHDEHESSEVIITREFNSFNEENGTKFPLMSKESCYVLYYVSTYLLAYFREKSAYSRVVKIVSMKDIVTLFYLDITDVDELPQILASVCDGDIIPIKNIIKDESIAENIRMDALQSLLILLANDVISRDELVLFFKELLRGKLGHENIYLAEFLCTCSAIIHPQELIEDITRAIEEGRITMADDILHDLDFNHIMPVQRSYENFIGDFKNNFITLEMVKDLKYWCYYDEEEDEDDEEDFDEDDEEDFDEDDEEDFDEDDDEDYDEDDDDYEEDDEEEMNFDDAQDDEDIKAAREILLQFTKKFDKTSHDEKFDQIFKNESEITAKTFLAGRNDPCPCGSGKKYKKCCIDKNVPLPIEPTYKEIYERNGLGSPDIKLTYNKEGYVSGMILDYIAPLLSDKPSINEYMNLLAVATASWNISFLPEYIQLIEVAKVVKRNAENKSYDQNTIKTTIKYLIDRKIELFPDIKLKIVDYEAKMVNGKIKVYVASQRLDTFK